MPATGLESTGSNLQRRLFRAVRKVADAYDLFLVLVLLLQANKNGQSSSKKGGSAVTAALSNPFVLFLILVVLTMAFDDSDD